MEVRIAATDEELAKVSDVLLELRPAFTKEALLERIREQVRDGYRLAYVESDGDVLCVAGFVVGTKLAWGKHIYVDDLVTRRAIDRRARARECLPGSRSTLGSSAASRSTSTPACNDSEPIGSIYVRASTSRVTTFP